MSLTLLLLYSCVWYGGGEWDQWPRVSGSSVMLPSVVSFTVVLKHIGGNDKNPTF